MFSYILNIPIYFTKIRNSKKITHEKVKINEERVPKVDDRLDKPIATKKFGQ
jgi:hypothetical protein